MKLAKLSPTIHDAFLTVGKSLSLSPGATNPLFGSYAYETTTDYDVRKTGTIYSTEEPQLFATHEKKSNLTLMTNFKRANNIAPRTAPTPIGSTSPTRKKKFAFGDTYEYEYDKWKEDIKSWRKLESSCEPQQPSSHVHAIKPKKTFSGKMKPVFFQQQLTHSTLPPQHLGAHEQLF